MSERRTKCGPNEDGLNELRARSSKMIVTQEAVVTGHLVTLPSQHGVSDDFEFPLHCQDGLRVDMNRNSSCWRV